MSPSIVKIRQNNFKLHVFSDQNTSRKHPKNSPVSVVIPKHLDTHKKPRIVRLYKHEILIRSHRYMTHYDLFQESTEWQTPIAARSSHLCIRIQNNLSRPLHTDCSCHRLLDRPEPISPSLSEITSDAVCDVGVRVRDRGRVDGINKYIWDSRFSFVNWAHLRWPLCQVSSCHCSFRGSIAPTHTKKIGTRTKERAVAWGARWKERKEISAL